MAEHAKLTVSMVEVAKAAGQAREIPDGAVPGLRLRVSPTGAKSWICRARIKGGPMKVTTIGRWPDVSLADARAAARDLLAEAAKGVPAAPAPVAEEPKGEAWSTLLERYLELEAVKLRTADDLARILRKETSAWADREALSIGRKDVVALLDGIVKRGSPIQANRTLAYVRRVFSWALSRGEVEVNPAAGIEKPGAETKRDRVLSDVEVRDLWRGLASAGEPVASMVRLLLLTGQRLREVAEARWIEFDLDKAEWTIPAERAKNNERHVVPLPDMALTVLQGLPRVGEFVITTRGDVPVNGFSKALAAVQRAMLAEGERRLAEAGEELRPVEAWTFHDLRRTAASGMAAAGARVEAIERVLNHKTGLTVGGLVRVYNRHSYEVEKREALRLWSERLVAIVG